MFCCYYRTFIFLVYTFGLCVFLGLIYVYFKRKIRLTIQHRRDTTYKGQLCVGIFHPYCNAGGGGERVLWVAIRALQKKYNNVKIIIYTGDINATPETILRKAKDVFNVAVDAKGIEFVYLTMRKWVEAERYPYCTLLGQSLGSVVLGIEAMCKFPPDVFLDTMGYAFVLPLFRYIAGARVGCYVHYPTISTDMLKRVQSRIYAHNNVVRNPFLTWLKLVYYRLFANIYSMVGRTAETIMVNSSWTENHIISLWNAPFKTHRVYPPCEVEHLKTMSSLATDDKIIILSVGQFRPEKDHPLQLQALYELRTLLTNNENLWNKIRLIIVGSCRGEEDIQRMKNMRDLSKHLALENNVEFKVNISHQELIQTFQVASIGIHTMWNEHFGIGVVECMAAGLIMIAHRSGGPLMDIVETSEGSQTGFLGLDAIDYAKCIATVLYNSKEQNDTIRKAARASVDRFSESEFEKGFLRAVDSLFTKQ